MKTSVNVEVCLLMLPVTVNISTSSCSNSGIYFDPSGWVKLNLGDTAKRCGNIFGQTNLCPKCGGMLWKALEGSRICVDVNQGQSMLNEAKRNIFSKIERVF